MRLVNFIRYWIFLLKSIKNLRKEKNNLKYEIPLLIQKIRSLEDDEKHARILLNTLQREYDNLSKRVDSLKCEEELHSNKPNVFKVGFLGLLKESRSLLDSMADRFSQFEGELTEFGQSNGMAFLPLSDVNRFIEEATKQLESLASKQIANDFSKAAVSAIEEAIKNSLSGAMAEAYFYAVVASTWAEAALGLEEILGNTGFNNSQKADESVDYYEVLGIDFNADAKEVKQAYRKRAKETHPDTNGNVSKSEFLKVQLAYSILSSPLERQKYDERYVKEKNKNSNGQHQSYAAA